MIFLFVNLDYALLYELSENIDLRSVSLLVDASLFPFDF